MFDIGSHSFRLGYAGEEFPKVIISCHFFAGFASHNFLGICFSVGEIDWPCLQTDIPSHIGVLEAIDKVDTTVDATPTSTKKYYIGDAMVTVPRAGMEVESFVRDGMSELKVSADGFYFMLSVENWDIFEQLLDYSYNRCVFSESKFHPVLFTEPAVSFGEA